MKLLQEFYNIFPYWTKKNIKQNIINRLYVYLNLFGIVNNVAFRMVRMDNIFGEQGVLKLVQSLTTFSMCRALYNIILNFVIVFYYLKNCK